MSEPIYQMTTYEIIDGKMVNIKEQWLPMNKAGVLFDSNWIGVEMGNSVMLDDGVVRPITEEEIRKIVDIADEHSMSK